MGTNVTRSLPFRTYAVERAWPEETAHIAAWVVVPRGGEGANLMFPLTPLDIPMQSVERVVFDLQSRLLTHALGSLLPGGRATEVMQASHLVHLGCGPGTWTIELAMAHPGLEITGLDIQAAMIDQANREAHRRGLHWLCHQRVESLAGPFAFPSGSVDLLTMRCVSHLLPSWASLLGECARLLRPGGRIHILDAEAVLSNAPAHTELMSLLRQAGGRNASHAGSLQEELEDLLKEQGFHSSSFTQTINYSYGAPLHAEWKRAVCIAAAVAGQELLRRGLLSQPELEALSRQHILEMNLPWFQAFQPIVVLWGTKA